MFATMVLCINIVYTVSSIPPTSSSPSETMVFHREFTHLWNHAMGPQSAQLVLGSSPLPIFIRYVLIYYISIYNLAFFLQHICYHIISYIYNYYIFI